MYLTNAKSRAKRDNVPYNLTIAYLESIVTDTCPIFGTPFVWGASGLGKGNTRDDTPTLDRILPELGYIEGNVAFLSYRANRVKDNGTMQEHYDIADWIWERTRHVREKKSSSVPAEHFSESKECSPSGAVHGTGPREDCDGSHHHTGESEREDTRNSAKAGCRICLGARGKKLEPLEAFAVWFGNGCRDKSVESFAKRLGCICYQS